MLVGVETTKVVLYCQVHKQSVVHMLCMDGGAVRVMSVRYQQGAYVQ